MELRHVRYFDAIAETLNFTRAAERLHVTQSTLSHQIRQMENELGVELFDRSAKKIRMTESGEILRTYLTPALEQIDRGIQVTVEELSAATIVSQLAADQLDLAVSYRPERSELWFEPLYNEELRLVVATSHPLAKRRRVRMVELHHVRMVLLHPQFQTRQLLDDCFEAAGAEPLVVVQFNSVAPMIELIRQTGLAGIIGETAVTPSADLRVVPLEDPTPIRTPGMLWKKGATRSPMIKHLAAIIRRAAAQGG